MDRNNNYKSNKYDYLEMLFCIQNISFHCQNPYEQIAAQFIVQTMRVKENSCSGNKTAIARAGNYFFLLKVDLMFIALE